MLLNLKANKILWLVVAGLTAIAAGFGLAGKEIYLNVVSPFLLPGVYGQDLISLAAAMVLALLAATAKETHYKKQIAALGILGYLFYAYGIYVIEQVYTGFYLAYLAIWTLAFWGMVYGMVNMAKDRVEKMAVPDATRKISIAAALLQPLVFIPLWVSALLPLLRAGNRIENLFSIYIIDLCFIMPAFLILSWLLLKRRAMALPLAPALFILGFVIIFSLVVSELVKPVFGVVPETGAIVQSGALSALFLFVTILHFSRLKIIA
jgi:multisubunit Na+/H+ antiporter MnhF subunit